MDGATPKLLSSVTGTVALAKTGASRLDWGAIYNPNGAVAFLQLFDAAAANDVTLGSTAPNLSIPLPAGAVLNLDGIKCRFLAGICIAATTTVTGSTGPSSAVVANLGVR